MNLLVPIIGLINYQLMATLIFSVPNKLSTFSLNYFKTNLLSHYIILHVIILVCISSHQALKNIIKYHDYTKNFRRISSC